MCPITVPDQKLEYIQEDGMLFVRSEGILQTMIKVPIILAGIIIVAMIAPFQNSFSSSRSLNLIIYPDGSTHVSTEIEVNPLEPDFQITLFGSSIDNFVATADSDFLLSFQLINSSAIIETLGFSSVFIDYDTHDLVSKSGKVWTFSIDSPIDYSLQMPHNSIIVGMSTFPLDMEIVDDKTKLLLPAGQAEINYVFGTPTITPSDPTKPDSSDFDYTIAIIGGAIAAAGIGGAIFYSKNKKLTPKMESSKEITNFIGTQLNPETIFNLRPELRDDDKELIKFLFENGGQAFESELRKKFLQPRTTMWRAVKRLERQGIVEINKKDLQNLVKLKKIWRVNNE
jgi:uncharacterized membrane protein